jgi:hypothetical protein
MGRRSDPALEKLDTLKEVNRPVSGHELARMVGKVDVADGQGMTQRVANRVNATSHLQF